MIHPCMDGFDCSTDENLEVTVDDIVVVDEDLVVVMCVGAGVEVIIVVFTSLTACA